MNYRIRQPGFDQIYLTYLPSYTATAWFHNQLPNRPPTVEEAVAAARQFAEGPYAAALANGQTISPEERDAVPQRMSEWPVLPADFIERLKRRVALPPFTMPLSREGGMP